MIQQLNCFDTNEGDLGSIEATCFQLHHTRKEKLQSPITTCMKELNSLSNSTSKSLILLISIETDHTGITWNINALFSLLRGHQKLFWKNITFASHMCACDWKLSIRYCYLFFFLTSNIVVYWLAYTGNQISWNSIKNLQKKIELWLK